MHIHFEVLNPSFLLTAVLIAVTGFLLLTAWNSAARLRSAKSQALLSESIAPSKPPSHWDKVALVLAATVTSANTAAEKHAAAANRLEATAYALQKLKAELSRVMDVPFEPLQAPAEVVARIEPAPRQSEPPAIAA